MSRRRQEPLNLLRQMKSEIDRMFDEPWTLFRWPPTNAMSDGPTGQKIPIQDSAPAKTAA